jgi:CubicO group peptidase (beta-lactamase class C family)
MYDLASLTKVVATTMVGMKLYEMGAYKLKDSLGKFLPDSLKFHLPYPSTIRNITFEELFVHQSGMPAGFPIIRYMQYTSAEVGRFDKYYCDRADTSYCIEVAENYFLEKEYADSMWLKLNQIWLDKSKPYKYSDVNMNTLYMMFKSIIQSNPSKYGFIEPAKKLKEKDLFVEFLYNTYYKPLGMERTRYKPLRHYNATSIVPTEDESFWRKQLLQGHVHDPNAALMGGIAGNAGMFSTTNDLAILCQMMLNKGVYNNQRFLKEETVIKFTSAQETSTRGLGFNKKNINTTGYGMADSCSLLTYGHTGFTGTCFWIDPQSDLIYIFLANRVHPKVNNRIYGFNIRKRIHNFAYDARLN